MVAPVDQQVGVGEHPVVGVGVVETGEGDPFQHLGFHPDGSHHLEGEHGSGLGGLSAGQRRRQGLAPRHLRLAPGHHLVVDRFPEQALHSMSHCERDHLSVTRSSIPSAASTSWEPGSPWHSDPQHVEVSEFVVHGSLDGTRRLRTGRYRGDHTAVHSIARLRTATTRQRGDRRRRRVATSVSCIVRQAARDRRGGTCSARLNMPDTTRPRRRSCRPQRGRCPQREVSREHEVVRAALSTTAPGRMSSGAILHRWGVPEARPDRGVRATVGCPGRA